MRERTCAPNPNLLESMRSVGYDLNTAVADIIDNSIAANATKISILYFGQGEEPYIAIVDNGNGMSEKTAFEAMQLAGNSPNKDRASNDLGRFGLGLKTASLSQARSLLMTTLQNGARTTLRWGLDAVARAGEWTLEQLNEKETLSALPQRVHDAMPVSHGTCILWRNLDKLETLAGRSLREIDKAMEELTGYLALVFHRFTHPYPDDNIRQIVIDVNGCTIPQRDPFLRDNPAVQTTGVQRISTSGATLRGYTLPYQNRLRDEDRQLLNLSEQRGKTLTDTQGFYVYRAYRLITWGSWFRMLPKKQATKLSRVQVDIPNSLDAEWTLDIKKSRATPPKIVSEVMKRYVDRLAKPSRRAQQFRGRRKNDDPYAPVWDIVNDRDGVFRYEINRSNPYIASFLDALTVEQQKTFMEMAKILSATIPYEDMQSRFAMDQRADNFTLNDDQARVFAKQMWTLNEHMGLTPERFVEYFRNTEPMSLCRNGEMILKEVSHV